MAEIEKAEKAARKKDRKRKTKSKSAQVASVVSTGAEPDVASDNTATDSFQIDTTDPRFSRLFSEHEFAIDPTNPRFRSTGGMRQLLEETRRRREMGHEDEHGGSFGERDGYGKLYMKDANTDD